MNQVIKSYAVPEYSKVSEYLPHIHYCDCYQVVTKTDLSVDQLTTEIFQTPHWADVLLNIRNALVKLVELQAGGNKLETHIAAYYPPGTKAVYFTVTDRTEQEIIMAEKDTHLDFWVSVMICREDDQTVVSLITLVKYNNLLGRIYYFFVKPFHRIICSSLMKRLLKSSPQYHILGQQ